MGHLVRVLAIQNGLSTGSFPSHAVRLSEAGDLPKVAAMAKVVATEKTPYPPVPNVVEQQVGEKRWQFEKRMREHNLKKGSRFMAMNIEPFMWERHRVARTMTDEDRFLRRQWLRDQILSPDEPRRVHALEAKSGLRGYSSIPLDKLETGLTRVVGFFLQNSSRKSGLFSNVFIIHCRVLSPWYLMLYN